MAIASLPKRVLRKAKRLRDRFEAYWRKRYFLASLKQIHGPSHIEKAPLDVVLVCLVRNGRDYLDAFLEHYRSLGINHMVFLDNGSTDGTIERLRQEADVTVLTSARPFKTYKHIMRGYLVEHYGPDNWVLLVDVDELFDYPFRTSMPLPRLISYLNVHGFTAVVAHMLDLFPKDSLQSKSENWRDTHCYFDVSAMEHGDYVEYYGNNNIISNREIKYYIGGIRSSAFGSRSWLSKHPLTYPSKGALIEYDHHIRNGVIADFSAVLLHYKYVGNFLEYIREAVSEGSMFDGSVHYRKYLQVLEANPSISMYGPNSVELKSVEQLVDCGLLNVSANMAEAVAWEKARAGEADQAR